MKLVVKNIRSEGGAYLSIDFQKPLHFSFAVGECFDLAFDLPGFKEGRIFSFSSSPTEEYLSVAFKKGYSDYKHRLEKIKKGDELTIRLLGVQYRFLYGKPMVFFAGGIGITVFRSALKYMLDKDRKAPIVLVYLNRDSKFPFKKELEAWRKTLPLIIHYLETTKEGRLTQEKVKKLISNVKEKSHYVIGPPLMVDATVETLHSLGVKETNIHTDSFDGYNEDIT